MRKFCVCVHAMYSFMYFKYSCLVIIFLVCNLFRFIDNHISTNLVLKCSINKFDLDFYM